METTTPPSLRAKGRSCGQTRGNHRHRSHDPKTTAAKPSGTVFGPPRGRFSFVGKPPMEGTTSPSLRAEGWSSGRTRRNHRHMEPEAQRRGGHTIRQGCSVQTPGAEGARPIRCEGDEDEDLGGVGSLERGKPILLLTDTLGHSRHGHLGARADQVRERRLRKRRGRGRRGEDLREVKTQERIGSNRRGNTWRMDARIPM